MNFESLYSVEMRVFTDINGYLFFLSKYRNMFILGDHGTVGPIIWFEFQLDISKLSWDKGFWQSDRRTTEWSYKGSFLFKKYGTLMREYRDGTSIIYIFA